MSKQTRFWEKFKDQKVFLAFKVTGSGSDIKKMPIGVDGNLGAAAGDMSRLGAFKDAQYISDYTAVSLTQPLVVDEKYLVCLDFDWKRTESKAPNEKMKQIIQSLLDDGHEYESSASGMGAHIWVLMDQEEIPKKFKYKDGCEIEVFSGFPGQRANVIFTGKNPSGELKYLPKWTFVSTKIADIIKGSAPAVQTKRSNQTDINKTLSYVPNADLEYDEWLKVGMALKDELGASGFSVWDAWSAQSSKYDPSVMRSKWDSFKGQGVGFGTVVMMARNNGMPRESYPWQNTIKTPVDPEVQAEMMLTLKRRHSAFVEATKIIEEAQTLESLIDDAVQQIKKMTGLDRLSISMLGDSLKNKAKSFKSHIPVTDARKMLVTDEIKMVESNRSKVSFQNTELAKEWVFLEQSCEFYKPESGEKIPTQALNIKFMSQMPEDDSGNRKEPSKMFSEFGGKCVYTDMFVPEMYNPDDPFFSINGINCVNSYSDRTTPEYDNNWESGSKWKMVENHIYKIFESPEDAKTLINWLAHNVQHPGKKILWACIVVGVPGDGKSSIARVMSSAMGHRNVKNIGLDEVKSSFTSWAEGSCLGVIEELRVTGQNRHEVMDRLKPFITNKSVAIVKKGKDGVDKPNTQNYLCFSNHADALALDDSDRRWAVFSTKYKSREDVVAQNGSDYWEELYDAIDNSGSEIRSWLLNVDLSSFNKNAPPASTQAKKQMIIESKHDISSNLAEMLVGTSYGYSENVVILKYLAQDMKKTWNASYSAKFLAKHLRELGFVPIVEVCPEVVNFWWCGSSHKPFINKKWVEGKLLSMPKDLTNDQIRDFLIETIKIDLRTSEAEKF